jgi:hypothetical protein
MEILLPHPQLLFSDSHFISEDPIGWASEQTNNYAYVGGNPVNHLDPSGMYCLSEGAMGAWGGGIGGAFAGAVNGFAMGGIPGMFVMGGLGALGGAAAGYVGTDNLQAGGIRGAAAGMMASGGTFKSDLFGGTVGGIVAADLTQSGWRDTQAGIVGGGVAGAVAGATAGFLKNELLKGAGMGGLAGVAGAALGSAVTEGLRYFNSCD